MEAVVWAGAWAATGTTAWVTITCSLQVNQPTFSGSGHILATTVWGAPAGTLAGRAGYWRVSDAEIDNYYLCTVIEYLDHTGPHEVIPDFAPEPGIQCALLATAGVRHLVHSTTGDRLRSHAHIHRRRER
jgi:hypothetical protein